MPSLSWWPWARSPADRHHRRAGKAGSGAVDPQDRVGADRAAAEEGLLADGLTGLGNRLSLKDRLDAAVGSAPPIGPRAAVVYVDIDDFTRVNEACGQAAGDDLLRAAAGRIESVFSEQGTVFRSGGDEFVALLERVTPEEAVKLATVALGAISEPFDTDCARIRVTASVGVVMLGERARADGLLRDADLTMHRAKAEGGNRVDIYSSQLDYWALSLEAGYRQAGTGGRGTAAREPDFE